MLFNSIQFGIFFLVVTTLYYKLTWRWRWKMLLAASCVFYMAFIPAYIAILFTTILIDYVMAIYIEKSQGWRRKLYLQISIASTCLVLFIFKYSTFFGLTVQQLQRMFGFSESFPVVHFILPIGLSFHTFQSLSYVIEVYRGHQKSERNLGIYSLYVMFYPQLVAGPIERPQNLLHQFYADHRFDVNNLRQGITLIAWGLFQKMVIADRCALYVNHVFAGWAAASGLTMLLAVVLFAVQIYSDFSGYSSVAIGCARVMGFELMTNFRRPYFSTSFAEFWKRWHISLSTWFRDYLYIPLGGNRASKFRHCVNLLITFTVSGLWHGANWTFIVWGALNGALLVVEHLFTNWGRQAPVRWIGQLVRRTLVLSGILAGWVFFRASNLPAAMGILKRIGTQFVISRQSLGEAILGFTSDVTSVPVGVVTFILVGVMFAIEWSQEFGARKWTFATLSPGRQFTWCVLLLEMILLFGSLRPSAFVYFQF